METGLEVFIKQGYRKYKKLRLGFLCNQASNTRDLRHLSELVTDPSLGLKTTCFFGPQHGIRGEKQDNMVESSDFIDPLTSLPVYSLYSTSRDPSDSALERIDAFVVDLQDIGTRIYTFMYTLANCMRAAKRTGKKVIVLDRPNPIDGVHLEGNVLEKEFTSFVGQFPICVRHGMTLGELAQLFNDAFGIHCDLEIVPLRGWKRGSFAGDDGREWVPPSPNIPSPTSALVFPGGVYFEGTNLSEGRGTTRPFEWIGAPYINPDFLAREMNQMEMDGVYFRPIFFQPTYQKWKDQVCGGVQVHVTHPKKFNGFLMGIRLLGKIAELFPKGFEWKKPPYEYELDRMPIDLIAGTDRLRKTIVAGKSLKAFEEKSLEELAAFKKLRAPYLLYKGK
jgi:uncharacterized protein YbbC (DUF1343 family)